MLPCVMSALLATLRLSTASAMLPLLAFARRSPVAATPRRDGPAEHPPLPYPTRPSSRSTDAMRAIASRQSSVRPNAVRRT